MDNSSAPNIAPSAPNSASVEPKAPGTPEVAPEAKAPPEAPYKLKTKVKGQEAEREYTRDELQRLVQLGMVSEESFQKGATAKKQAENLIRMLQEDPISVLTNPQLNIPGVREKVEKWLHSQLESEMLSPEQKAKKEMEAELKKYRDQEEEAKRSKEQERLTQVEQHWVGEYDKKITAALSTSGLPKSPQTVKMMTQLMAKALDAGYDADPADIVPLVKQHYMDAIRELFGSTEGDALIALVGDEFTNKVRKADVARLRNGQFAKQAPTASSGTSATQPRGETPAKKMTMAEYDAQTKETLARIKRGEL